MSTHGYLTVVKGKYTGVYSREPALRCKSHGPSMRPVASAGGHCPHYYCPHCSKVYVLIGGELARCETPDLCVVGPMHFLDKRKSFTPEIQAGPMGRGLL